MSRDPRAGCRSPRAARAARRSPRVLNLWGLSINGWANTYYSAAVRSMSTSWHNFLFASLDPSGLMTVDKPPLSLWVQALSARVFGFHPLSMLVPQALMGVVAVGLVYDLVRRRFGRVAGFVAGLALAITPIVGRGLAPQQPRRAARPVLRRRAVVRGPRARDRAHALARAERDRRRARVRDEDGRGADGRARNRRSPGCGCAGTRPRGRLARAAPAARRRGRDGRRRRLAWPLLVTLTPAADRPWISGTSDNSIWSLIFGYNGLGRVAGQTGGPAAVRARRRRAAAAARMFGGATGPFRLLQSGLGDQAGWLLGFALVAGLALLVLTAPAPARPAHRLADRGRRRVPRRPRSCSASPAGSSTRTTSRCSRRSSALLVGAGVGADAARAVGARRLAALRA